MTIGLFESLEQECIIEEKNRDGWSSDGYTGDPCINCKRIRVQVCNNGKTLCEKCEWCPELDRYVDFHARGDLS